MFRKGKYLDFYRTRSDQGDFIILDNGAAEGILYGTKHLFTLAKEIGASEIVIPDTLGDANDTLAQAQAFARYAQSDYQYMFVLQGSTAEEVMFCLRALDNGNMFSYVTTLGIPRHLYAIDSTFRTELTKMLIHENFHLRYNIHFLGASQWMKEIWALETLTRGLEGFRGIDTSLPIYMGLEDLSIETDSYMPRPQNFFTRSDDNEKVINMNMAIFLSWAKYYEPPA